MADTPEINYSPPSMANRDDGSTIAYHRTPGKTPGVVFLTGFMSNMEGDKALALETHCLEKEISFLRFDYRGHGQSSGRFIDGCIGDWAEDAIWAIDNLTEGPQVLVGSSMGGWIMLLAALARRDRVAGLLGLAAAPDFTHDLLPSELTPDQMKTLTSEGVVWLQSPYGDEPVPITRKLVEDGRQHLLFRQPIELDIPVRLIHGMQDQDVPWGMSLRLTEALTSKNVESLMVKDGDHRLSRPEDLKRMIRTLDDLLAGI